jgi:predicted transcriptional regulator
VGGITPNTLNTRIKELRECGLLEHGSDGYTVTLTGQDLLKRLSDVQAFANRWVAARARSKPWRCCGRGRRQAHTTIIQGPQACLAGPFPSPFSALR